MNPPSAPWSSSVVYQVYPLSFADSDGDGIGDLRGIIDRLDHIAALGADVLWLSPIYVSPQDDNGYDIADYRAIDPLFGTLADFDELVAAAHARDMKVVMDLVVNHTSDEHPWFVESRDPASDKRDWYIWRPEPLNWGSFFGGSSWELDPASGEYYLHLFGRKQPDLNWENPEVRAAVYDMMRWWVDRGVDGFRMDVINLISKTHPLTDGHQNPGEPYSYEVERVANGPRMIEFLEEMNREVGITERQLFTVGEMVVCDLEHAREYTSRAHDRLGMVFTFEHMSLDHGLSKLDVRPLHLPDLKKNLARWQAGLADDGWNSLYFENHDQPRSVSRFGDDSPQHRVASAKALATVLHLHQGTPYIYQGQEIGLPNPGFTSIEEFVDIEAKALYRQALDAGVPEPQVLAGLARMGRDNARSPIPWGAGDGPVSVANDVADPEGVFAHYQALIALRREREIVRLGRFELLMPEHEALWVFTRTLGDERLLVLANMSSVAVGVPVSELPPVEGAELLVSSLHPGTDLQTLAPWEARVYELRA